MSEQILAILKRKLDDLAVQRMDAETSVIRPKEKLQYYVLNFIYHLNITMDNVWRLCASNYSRVVCRLTWILKYPMK